MKKGSIFIIIIIIINACSLNNKKYYYALYYEDFETPSNYLLKEFSGDQNNRRVKTFNYDSLKVGELINSEQFYIEDGTLYKFERKDDSLLKKKYLSTSTTECINYDFENEEVNDMLSTKICFLDKVTDTADNILIRNSYKFKKYQGKQHVIESYVYYDEDLILLMEEYISGYTSNYKIVRLDGKP